MSRTPETEPPTRPMIGVIGTGLMGSAIAERLLAHGFAVSVWNRTQEKAEALLQLGARWSENPLAESDRVIISLYTSEIVSVVVDRMRDGLRPGQILVDTTTGDPEHAVALAQRLRAMGVTYLDAPISGSSEQTRRGDATVIVGGCEKAFGACADLWPILGKKVFYVGPNGAAARMKLVTNLVLGLNRAALAEGIVFAERIGIDPRVALQVLIGSAAYSRTMDIKGQKMLDGEFSTQARLSQHLKDVQLILKSAAEKDLPLPLSDCHHALLVEAERKGLGDLDNSAIIQVLRKAGGTAGL